MTRVVKDYHERWNEILDCAQHFFFNQGYEGTSIQMIIDEVGIAKGTFYHYFRSKEDLLDALTERMLNQTLEVLTPKIEDDQLSSLEKFHFFMSYLNNWKLENISFFKELMKVYYREENALFREKMKLASIRFTVPLLSRIIHQGNEEGSFDSDDPELAAEIIIEMGQPLARTFADLMNHADRKEDAFATIKKRVSGYQTAIERVLGAQPGSLHLIDLERLRAWL